MSGNSAVGNGGGIANEFGIFGGTLTVSNSVLSGNLAGVFGGGLYNDSTSSATVAGSTVSDNTAESDGGGIYNAGFLRVGTTAFSGNRPDALANFGNFIDLGGNTGL